MPETPSIRKDLARLAAVHGPLEVSVVMAPEPFSPERGVRRLGGAWRLDLGVVSMKVDRKSDGDPIENIGDLTLVLTEQTATALHSFLAGILDPASRPQRRPQSGNLLPMVEPPER